MKKAYASAALLLGILLAGSSCSRALDPSLDISQYGHTAWKVRDGFINGIIDSFAQTPDGYLWLGADSGLYRFDGVGRPVPWQPPAGQQLPSSLIRDLLVSRDGTLWIGTQKGLAKWKDGRLTTLPELAGQIVGKVFQDRLGTVWISLISPGRICAVRGAKVECNGSGSFGNSAFRIYEDRKGNLWVSGETAVWRWAPGPPRKYALPPGVRYTNALIEDDAGELLIGTPNGLYQLSDGRIRKYALAGIAGDIRASPFFRSKDGHLWIGTDNQGVLQLRDGRIEKFSAIEGLTDDGVVCIFEDREGTIWVSTLGGLDRFRVPAVSTISRDEGLLNATVASVEATADGSVWIGTRLGLSRWQDGRITTYRSVSSLKGNRDPHPSVAQSSAAEVVNSVLRGAISSQGLDARGRLWVATAEAVYYFDKGRFVSAYDALGGNVASISGDGRGNVWILNGNVGFFKWKPEGVVEKISWPGPPGYFWAALLLDLPKDGLWLGFLDEAGGLAYLKDGRVLTTYTAANGLGKGRVTHLRFGSRGALWAATQGGLSRIKDGHIATLTSANGLPCETVHWSIEDDDHSVWLYMPCGLVRIARSELDAWVSDPRYVLKTTLFDSSDGVRSRPIVGGTSPAVTKSSDGRIWFATFDGVSVVDPHHLAFNKLPPPVHIENIRADDKTVAISNGMHLPTGVRHLDIDYTALSLVVPEKVRFRVKLEGEDKDWRELFNVRHVEYTNLSPRHYKFRVLACNNSGVWNVTGDSLDFTIPPAWYQTNWFYALCALAFLALTWGLYQLRVLQLQREFNAVLEARVGERTRVARDIHDTLLQSFQALLPLFQVAIYKLPEGAADARNTLELALDRASNAVAEGRDAIQGLRSSTVEKNDLALAIETVGEEVASADANPSSPKFNVVVEGTSRDLHPILRDEIYRIAAEALRNAFRHAEAKSVEVEIRYDAKHFQLRIRDDGKGIPDEVLRREGREGHYGMPGMRERAKLMGGRLTIWTEVDGGTEIELFIPASKVYAKSHRRFWHVGKGSPTDTDVKARLD
ncbi:MAG: two-component regulator propeller domain-containing protein [Terracidiphilus sp.]